MQTTSLLEKVESLALQAAERHSCVLYDLEFSGSGSHRVLRVFIDKPALGEGVSIEDCSLVSQSLNLLLDVEDPIPGGGYNLEVSSPGLERKLKRKEHFESALGQKIFVRSARAFGDVQPELKEHFGLRKQAELTLLRVDQNQLVLTDDEVELLLPIDEIEKSHVVFTFEDSPKPKPGSKPAKGKKSKPKGKR